MNTPICSSTPVKIRFCPTNHFTPIANPPFMGNRLFQMREVLRKHDLHKAPEFLEPEDHISVEFDFLAEMNRREQAGDQAAIDARIDFGRRNMAWRTEFCAVLHAADTSGFYKALAELTLGYLFVAHLSSVPSAEASLNDPAFDLIDT